jgi:Phage integrase family
MHLSARSTLVFACFADAMWTMYDFLRPGVSVANADLRTASASSLLCNSSGIGYSEGFLSSTLFPDFSNSMASSKTERSRRTIDFPAFVVPVLSDHERKLHETKALVGTRWQENGLVFPSEVGSPADERNVLRRFQKVCSDNDLPKLRVYDLRHTHASLLINEGVHPKRISERLGHSSIKLTMDTYGHLFEGSDRDSAEKMQRMFGSETAPDEKEKRRHQSGIALVPRKVS